MNDFSALVIFNLFVLGMLALDLGVFHRRGRAVSLREAAIWSAFWVTLSLAFNAGVYFWRGPEAALDFLRAYILEKSLSLDNVFVFAMIFRHTAVPPQYQHQLLFWGILGALVMRGVFIILGSELVSHFKWILYLFGLFLIIAGATFHRSKRTEIHPDRSPLLALVGRILPVTEQYEGGTPQSPHSRHAPFSGLGDGREYRRFLCNGFYPDRLRGHPRPIHPLHLQCLCDPGIACSLLLAPGGPSKIPLLARWCISRADVYGSQARAGGLLPVA
jgi:predicted tellurium resistance membrane protein TerC